MSRIKINKKIVLLIAFIIISSVMIVIVTNALFESSIKVRPGPDLSMKGINWYPIKDWEYDFCRKWGGNKKSSDIELEPIVVNNRPITVTIQATHRKLLNSKNLYEIGYYVEPLYGEVYYRIILHSKNENIDDKLIVPRGVASVGGYTDYLSRILSDNYDTVQIRVNDTLAFLEVPFVEKE